MNRWKNVDPEIFDLFIAACSGELSAEQTARLEAALLSSEPLRRRYTDFCRFEAELRLHGQGERAIRAAKDLLQDDSPATPNRSSLWLSRLPAAIHWQTHPARFGAVAVLLLVVFWAVFGLFVWPWWRGAGEETLAEAPPAYAPHVARLRQAVDCQWDEPKAYLAPSIGIHLEQGRRLKLKQGLAEVVLDDGAAVILEGPCEFAIESRNAISLSRGKLAATVPEEAIGFLVDTPFGTVIDFGTQFGVEVDTEATAMAVYQGEAGMEITDSSGRKRAIRLTAGQTARADRTGRFTTGAGGVERLAIVRTIPHDPIGRSKTAPPAAVGVISIGNPSFESPDQADLQRLSDGSAYLAGWHVREDIGRGGIDVYLAGPKYSTAASPDPTDGDQFVVMSGYGAEGGQATSGAVYQLSVVSAPLAPNTTYTLTFDIGNRDTSTNGDTTTTVEAFFTLDHTDVAVTHTANAVGTPFSMTLGDIPRGAMLTDRTATFTTGSTDLHHSLNICLKQTSTDPNSANWAQSRWDNIRLRARPASVTEGMAP